MPLRRALPPDFWAQVERDWLARLAAGHGAEEKLRDPLTRTRKQKTLAQHFHEGVRAAGQPALCAYCDGDLGVTSPRTVDHFFPRSAFPDLALCWTNLYPACVTCNSTHKGTRYSCRLLRPDVDLAGGDDLAAFSSTFLFDPESGRLWPAPELDRITRLRVKLTLRVLGLNTVERRKARRTAWSLVRNAAKPPADGETLQAQAIHGPYRFIALEMLRG